MGHHPWSHPLSCTMSMLYSTPTGKAVRPLLGLQAAVENNMQSEQDLRQPETLRIIHSWKREVVHRTCTCSVFLTNNTHQGDLQGHSSTLFQQCICLKPPAILAEPKSKDHQGMEGTHRTSVVSPTCNSQNGPGLPPRLRIHDKCAYFLVCPWLLVLHLPHSQHFTTQAFCDHKPFWRYAQGHHPERRTPPADKGWRNIYEKMENCQAKWGALQEVLYCSRESAEQNSHGTMFECTEGYCSSPGASDDQTNHWGWHSQGLGMKSCARSE